MRLEMKKRPKGGKGETKQVTRLLTQRTAQLEPPELVPEGKTRLYLNFSTDWPIRPSIYYMKALGNLMQSKGSTRILENDFALVSQKMMKRYPDMSYTAEKCRLHLANVRVSMTIVRRMISFGLNIDQQVGLVKCSDKKFDAFLTTLPPSYIDKGTSLRTKNILDILKCIELSDEFGHRFQSTEENQKQMEEVEAEYGDDADENDASREDSSPEYESDTPQLPTKRINIILPTTIGEDKKSFDVEEFTKITEKPLDERALKKMKVGKIKAPIRKNDLIPAAKKVSVLVKKSDRACDYCRRMKFACTGELPSCSRCTQKMVKCSYSKAKTVKAPPVKARHSKQTNDVTSHTNTSDTSASSGSDTKNASSQTSVNDNQDQINQHLLQKSFEQHQQQQHQFHTPQPHQQQLVPSSHFTTITTYLPPHPRPSIVIPAEELAKRRQAVVSMLNLYFKGHFNDSQLLQFSRDVVTSNYKDDIILFEGTPDYLLAQILRNSIR